MRVLRIARVLKLLKMAKGIRSLLDTVIQALPQVGNLGLLFFLLFFIFAILGVELFGRLSESFLFQHQVVFSFNFKSICIFVLYSKKTVRASRLPVMDSASTLTFTILAWLF
jgi:hypothetical protein